MIEFLEGRTLWSASPALVPIQLASAAPALRVAHNAVVTRAGMTLHLTAGTPFNGEVGFYPSPVLDPPLGFSATINWGDKTAASAATLGYSSTEGGTGGYQIFGTHTYGKAGKFKVKITVLSGPIAQPGQPTPAFPTRVVAKITSKAIVAAAGSNGAAAGTPSNQPAGQTFTADLGSFTTIAPGTNLQASVSWGDGGTSVGSLNPSGVIGIDVLKFDVAGTHTYANPGTYPVHIVVTRPAATATGSQVVATIDTTVVVSGGPQQSGNTTPLSGTISGTFTTLPAPADVGKSYAFTGSGTIAGHDVSASGQVSLPGFIVSGQAGGTFTLTNSQDPAGSVTLQLTGPTEAGFGPFPTTLSYAVTQATGAYADAAGSSGSISVAITPAGSGSNQFTFVLG